MSLHPGQQASSSTTPWSLRQKRGRVANIRGMLPLYPPGEAKAVLAGELAELEAELHQRK